MAKFDFFVDFRGWPIPGAAYDGGTPQHNVVYSYDPFFSEGAYGEGIFGPFFNPLPDLWLPDFNTDTVFQPLTGKTNQNEASNQLALVPPSLIPSQMQQSSVTGGSVRGGQPLYGKQYWEVEVASLPTSVPSPYTFTSPVGIEEGTTFDWPTYSAVGHGDTSQFTLKWPTSLNRFLNPVIGLWPSGFTKQDVIGLDKKGALFRSIGVVRTNALGSTMSTEGGDPSGTFGPAYVGDFFRASDVSAAELNEQSAQWQLTGWPGKNTGFILPYGLPSGVAYHSPVFKGRGDRLASIKTTKEDRGSQAEYNGVWTGVDLGDWGQGSIIMLATDTQSRKVWFGRDGVWHGSPSGGMGEACLMDGKPGDRNYFPGASIRLGPTRLRFKFHKVDLTYPVPEGFFPYSSWIKEP